LTAFVTGAAGDFGRAVASRLAQSGARIALADLATAMEGLEDSAELCAKHVGPDAVEIVTFDVTDEEGLNTAVGAVVDRLGVPCLVFNNAGYQGVFVEAPDYPTEDAQKVLDINVMGIINVLQATARAMRAAGLGGAIVNSASMAGVGGAANMLAYCASKGAVISVTKAAAIDLAPLGVRVNAISPAFIGPGAMWTRQVELQAQVGSPYYSTHPGEVADEMVGQVPLRRLGSVDEVASVVTWLLSDEASYVTGENILVTGGII
jgi:NAD(P)-dependent dehydrogenase (short-subunit alcohol dehydrogenase family)